MLTLGENIKNIKEFIEKIIVQGRIAIFIDFDQLCVKEHATREFDLLAEEKYGKEIDYIILDNLGFNTFEGIQYLNSLFLGMNTIDWNTLLDEISKIELRPGFDHFLTTLLADSRFTIFIVSSGLREVCYSILRKINFPKNNIISGEFTVDNDKIIDCYISMSDTIKQFIINELSEKFDLTIGIGHGRGDFLMLDACEIPIAFGEELDGIIDCCFAWDEPEKCLSFLLDIAQAQ